MTKKIIFDESCHIVPDLLYVRFRYRQNFQFSAKCNSKKKPVFEITHVAKPIVWSTGFRYCSLRQRRTFKLVIRTFKKLEFFWHIPWFRWIVEESTYFSLEKNSALVIKIALPIVKLTIKVTALLNQSSET